MVKNMRRLLIVGVLAVLAFAPSARADFNIQIFTDAALTNQIYGIDDDGPGDSSTPLTGVIGTSVTSDLAALNAAVSATGLEFSNLSATSNASSPPASNIATLTINGEVRRLAGAPAVAELYILVSANDYNFPAGPSYQVSSNASHVFTNVAAGTSPSFQSYFNDSNTLNARETATGLLVFAPLPGNSSQALTAPTLVAPGSAPYSLTNVTRIRLTGAANASDLFNGATTVAVPEPSSLALSFLGGSALLFGRFRRRKAQA